jgi:carbohydrate-binding DOMON domain-containing protein
MSYRRGSIVMAGLLLGLLLALPFIPLPYDALDWTAYSQPYELTQTPTSTATLMPTSTATSVATTTATLTLTPPANLTTTPTPGHRNYMPLIRRSSR